jgi:hypothetical protein
MTLEQRIVKALRLRREQLMAELAEVGYQLNVWDPPPPIVVRTAAEQNTERVREALTSDWSAKQAVRSRLKPPVSKNATTRALNRLVEQGVAEHLNTHGIDHYRRARQELRLVAGYGQI